MRATIVGSERTARRGIDDTWRRRGTSDKYCNLGLELAYGSGSSRSGHSVDRLGSLAVTTRRIIDATERR